jgi:hypothetical protein
MVLVINNTEVPIKAKLRRKSQKKRVPRMEAENIPIDRDWWEFIPEKLAQAPREKASRNKESNFKERLFMD